jgi:formate dehydrogenase iron-sulfur subunit
MAYPQGWLHALCRPGLPEGLPVGRAIIQYANGIVDFQSEQCIGCGYCIAGCPFNVPRLNPKTTASTNVPVRRPRHRRPGAGLRENLPDRRDPLWLQRGYENAGGERVAELKTRGYDNAGLYDPAGVGGTHVMYVLHHADKPNLYHGLPENPEISATVKFWKGIWKPLAAVGFAATFAASIFHYVGVGPNRAEEEEETCMKRKTRCANEKT